MSQTKHGTRYNISNAYVEKVYSRPVGALREAGHLERGLEYRYFKRPLFQFSSLIGYY